MIKVEIVTPERLVHTVSGTEVLLPTTTGQIGVRRGHIPLITPLKAGQIIVKQEAGAEELYAVAGGFAEVTGTVVRVLADSAERADELNETAVQAAIERARQLKAESSDEIALEDAAAQIAANIARLSVIKRRKNHR